MDDALLKYDESLEALERQRENLERVMKRMGAEWEESGAGIGWLGDNLFKESGGSLQLTTNNDTTSTSSPPLMSLMHSVTSSEPSHDYLQSLLNVNDELLAQSLASTGDSSHNSSNSNNNNHAFYPPLVKSFMPSQQVLPISPISPDSGSKTENSKLTDQQLQVVNLTQFTPPITPE